MIFNSEYQIDVPNEDILTFLYSRTRFKEADPIWIDAADPRLHVTLSKARELTRRVGRGLRDLGIGGGKSEDIVLTFVENQVMVAPTLLGVLCAGGIHATCPMTATAFELGRQIRLSSPKVVICSRQTRKVAEEAIRIAQSGSSRGRGITPPQLLVMVSEDSDVIDDASPGKSIVSDRELQWESITDPDVLERTTACLVYSSGTTGLPKGVRMTHTNLVSNLCQMAFHFYHFALKSIRTENKYLRMPGIMQNAVVLGITVQTMMALQTGIQVYMFPKFDFQVLRPCIRKYSLSAFFLVPAVWNRISQECTPEELASFRFAMSGASPLPLPLQLKMNDLLPEGVMLRVNWGMTETTTGAAQPGPEEFDREGSSGRLLPNMQAIILGADGKQLGFGEPGELCVKGPNVIKEYFDNPEATESAFTSDGWFRTGDVTHFSRNGKLFIVGRSKELLKYKGNQVSPPELEAVLGQCPGVTDVGVIGVSDGQGNDLPRAYVVVSSSTKVSEDKIHAFLNSRVSPSKRLRGGIVFVAEVPRNLNGKIMRNVLQEWAKTDDPKARL